MSKNKSPEARRRARQRRRQRRRMHEGKDEYLNGDAARMAAWQLNRKGYVGLEAYECLFGDHWHVGRPHALRVGEANDRNLNGEQIRSLGLPGPEGKVVATLPPKMADATDKGGTVMTEPRQETGGPNRTPRSEITQAVPSSRKKEPKLLIDLSTSMDWSATDEQDRSGEWPSPQSRRYIVINALPLLIRALEASDSEAATEQAGGSDDLGGVLTVGFASEPVEIGDLNSSNLERKLNSITWGGGTVIMPAWKMALEDYDDEFGEREPGDQPTMLTVVLTDGQASDFKEFDKVIGTANPRRVFIIGIVGHGEPALATYTEYKTAAERVNAEKGHDVVHVVLWDGVTDPEEIGADLVTMAG